jgi:hypothetical protein
MIIMKAINYALKVNFPDKKTRLLSSNSRKEQDIAPKNRLINNIMKVLFNIPRLQEY